MLFQEIILEITRIFQIIWGVFRVWWWVILPFIVIRPFLFLWLWWRNEVWSKKQKSILLEIKLPKEVSKPIKAMETVFSGLWVIYDPCNWKEKWIEGKYLLSFSLEIVSIDGQPHFFIRVPESSKALVESNIYAQYPEVEIAEVPDYTQAVPQDIPNKDWDLWGCSFQTLKEDIYPIKTYSKFFEENIQTKEEKRIDPIAGLLEGMAKLKKGEQLWVQFLVKPITGKENSFLKRGKKKIQELARRPEKTKPKRIIQEAAEILIFKVKEEGEKEKSSIPSEMQLLSGEKEEILAIEEKMSKYFFEVSIRFIYLGKKDAFFKPHVKTPLAFFTQFSTQNFNGFKPLSKTVTKVDYFFIKRRTYVLKKRLLRLYKSRLNPFSPVSSKEGGKEGVFVLNIEELASLFHFPSEEVAKAPFLERLESKKGEPPTGLPT
ncbi:MAG: hypothetical protein LRZ96_01485 [Candidatus Pacebacteria bacterium]|nr:hypothetical protein [Candidatus Paceibacterota bacterium]